MFYALLVAVTLVFAIQAIRAKRLLHSALWLAGVSAFLAFIFYLLGAHQVAVIELSVGAGLVTVLFVFAISLAGEDLQTEGQFVPRPLAWGLIATAVLLLGTLVIGSTVFPAGGPVAEEPVSTVIWQQRDLDVLVQVVLIFSGILGLLGLLAEAKAPLQKSMAEEIGAVRDRELMALEKRAQQPEKELV
jgi:NADH:ubiquinone oxidoreductase subunit 6 (subunit J)